MFKIPNIGWFKLKCNNDYQGENHQNLTFKNINYFVHSYQKNFDLKTLIAHINYDDTLVPAIVKKVIFTECSFTQKKVEQQE